jgi:hypothetical protein
MASRKSFRIPDRSDANQHDPQMPVAEESGMIPGFSIGFRKWIRSGCRPIGKKTLPLEYIEAGTVAVARR